MKTKEFKEKLTIIVDELNHDIIGVNEAMYEINRIPLPNDKEL